jgi:hypothetical protein
MNVLILHNELICIFIKFIRPYVCRQHLLILVEIYFQAAMSVMFVRHANFIIWSSSKRSTPKDARRSTAVCLLAENSRSQGTEEA